MNKIKLISIFFLFISWMITINELGKTRAKLNRVKEFTKYKHSPGIIETCQGRILVKDSFRYFIDSEYKDSVLNLIDYR
jgi:hypothetical protein